MPICGHRLKIAFPPCPINVFTKASALLGQEMMSDGTVQCSLCYGRDVLFNFSESLHQDALNRIVEDGRAEQSGVNSGTVYILGRAVKWSKEIRSLIRFRNQYPK